MTTKLEIETKIERCARGLWTRLKAQPNCNPGLASLRTCRHIVRGIIDPTSEQMTSLAKFRLKAIAAGVIPA